MMIVEQNFEVLDRSHIIHLEDVGVRERIWNQTLGGQQANLGILVGDEAHELRPC